MSRLNLNKNITCILSAASITYWQLIFSSGTVFFLFPCFAVPVFFHIPPPLAFPAPHSSFFLVLRCPFSFAYPLHLLSRHRILPFFLVCSAHFHSHTPSTCFPGTTFFLFSCFAVPIFFLLTFPGTAFFLFSWFAVPRHHSS